MSANLICGILTTVAVLLFFMLTRRLARSRAPLHYAHWLQTGELPTRWADYRELVGYMVAIGALSASDGARALWMHAANDTQRGAS